MGVPHASEEFRDYLLWGDLPENESRYWVGPAPRLQEADGDERYAHAETGSGAFTTVTVTLEPFALTDRTTMSMQVRTLGVFADTFELFFADSVGTNYVYLVRSSGPTWQTISGSISDFASYDTFRPGLIAAASAGELVAGVLGPLGVGAGYGVSWIDVQIRPQPLQWRQRTDELGVSGVRPSRHASTYYATNRARGML